ncbi:MAG: hypothetical protein JRJ77_07275 [Deltaproteobacteria bacterium]|nr:hypothetical protein [Deltaproteobacteria bacterium]MBW2340360.1 hypothetical protein [Deltaproteobacteria bacterium]
MQHIPNMDSDIFIVFDKEKVLALKSKEYNELATVKTSPSVATNDVVAEQETLTDGSTFPSLIKDSDLSVRVTNVLMQNVNDVREIIAIDAKKLASFKNC